MENEKFITVLTVTFAHEVAIIRGRLEAEGITCFVKDEFTVQVHPFYSNAIGGVKLQVRESDYDQTIEILKETGYIKEEELQPPQENKHFYKPQIIIKDGEIICPICGSEEVVKRKKPRLLFLLTSLLFTFPTPFVKSTYYCIDCKQELGSKKRHESSKSSIKENIQ